MVVVPDQLVLFTVVNALRSLARLAPVLADDPEAGRGLVAKTASGQPLRSVLDSYVMRQRQMAADLASLLRSGVVLPGTLREVGGMG